MRDLVKESLRMRPSRIIVGEVRAEECLDLLLTLNAGLPGMCTLHATSAREALVKMCTLPLLAVMPRHVVRSGTASRRWVKASRCGVELSRNRSPPRRPSWLTLTLL